MNTSVFPIFWLVILVLSIIGRGSAAKKKTGSSGSAAAPAPRINRDYARKSKEDDDCDYGEANHKYSHESEGRIKQLDSYLKAGLIDKKEYAQMLARYKKAEQDFEKYQ